MDASGKTLAVEAVANELGALLINISPSKLRGLFPGKQGPTKLVHLVFTVARYQPMAPVVIYLDDCEQFFQGGGKKAKTDKEGPARFAKVRGREGRKRAEGTGAGEDVGEGKEWKSLSLGNYPHVPSSDPCSPCPLLCQQDLQTYIKQALLPEHRIVILGTSRHPENGDPKALKGFFDKFLYIPYPDYPSRLMLWKTFMREAVGPKVRLRYTHTHKADAHTECTHK